MKRALADFPKILSTRRNIKRWNRLKGVKKREMSVIHTLAKPSGAQQALLSIIHQDMDKECTLQGSHYSPFRSFSACSFSSVTLAGRRPPPVTVRSWVHETSRFIECTICIYTVYACRTVDSTFVWGVFLDPFIDCHYLYTQ